MREEKKKRTASTKKRGEKRGRGRGGGGDEGGEGTFQGLVVDIEETHEEEEELRIEVLLGHLLIILVTNQFLRNKDIH